jgi:hypothetical protein
MSFLNRVTRSTYVLTLCLALLLIGGSAFSLAHCYGEHAHGRDVGKCALCAFVCNVAAVFLAIVFLAGFTLVGRIQPSFPGRTDLLSGCSPYPIRAPPMSSL